MRESGATSGTSRAFADSYAKVSTQVLAFRNPAGGSRWIVQSRPTGHWQCTRIPPAAAGGSFNPSPRVQQRETKVGTERSTGCPPVEFRESFVSSVAWD